jgi:OOP family OmpA-OmpF porin
MKILLASLVLTMTTATAVAADENGRWYVGIGAGPSSLHNVCSTVESQGLLGTCDDESVGWKVFVGRDLSKYFGLELSYADAGEAEVVGPSSADTLNVHPQLATLSGKLEIPFGKRFSILGKVGLTYFKTDYERTGVFRTMPSGDDGVEPSLGAGFGFKVSRAVGIRAEWEHFNDAVGLGSGDIDLVTASLLFKF